MCFNTSRQSASPLCLIERYLNELIQLAITQLLDAARQAEYAVAKVLFTGSAAIGFVGDGEASRTAPVENRSRVACSTESRPMESSCGYECWNINAFQTA